MRLKIHYALLVVSYVFGIMFLIGCVVFFTVESLRIGAASMFRVSFSRFEMLFLQQKIVFYAGVFLIEGIIALCYMPFLLRMLRQQALNGQLYFVALFFLTLTLDGLRLWVWWISWGGVPEQVVVNMAKAVLLMKLYGDVFLFSASLYDRDVSGKNTGTLTLILLLSAACFVFLIPVDIRSLDIVDFLVLRGEFRVDNISVVISLMTIVNYVYHLCSAKSRRYHRYGLVALMGIVVARNVLFYTSMLFVSAGAMLLLCVASALYLRSVKKREVKSS